MSGAERPRLAELALALQHDVGKYLTRAARNLPPSDIPPVLLDMLVADLFRTDGTHDALSVYEARIAASGVDEAHVPGAIRAQLVALMALESDVRRHDGAAVKRARALALAVDDACRAFVHAQRDEGDEGARG